MNDLIAHYELESGAVCALMDSEDVHLSPSARQAARYYYELDAQALADSLSRMEVLRQIGAACELSDRWRTQLYLDALTLQQGRDPRHSRHERTAH